MKRIYTYLRHFETIRMRLFKMNRGWDYRGVTKLVSLLWKNVIFKTCTIEANHLYNRHWSWKTGSMLGISEKALGMGSWLVVWNIFVISRSILDGYKLILTSLLVSIGISTNQQRIIFLCGVSKIGNYFAIYFFRGVAQPPSSLGMDPLGCRGREEAAEALISRWFR